jgi:putative hydrolase of the HAD superfamily
MQATLVFDADDTLWDEQCTLQQFEQALEARLAGLTGVPSDFRRRFAATEETNIPRLGYGFASYLFSVAETLAATPCWPQHKAEMLDLVADFATGTGREPRPIMGVRPTLELLSQHAFRLVVLSRGDDHEQRTKLQRSGLSGFFSEVRVVRRKDVGTYHRTAHELGDPQGAALCMIGNSMRSDIGPALDAGWRAIHVPAPTAWGHDHGGTLEHARFRQASDFEGVADLVLSAGFWG